MLELHAAEGEAGTRLITPAGNTHPARASESLRRLRSIGRRHPEWWMLPTAAAAWMFMAMPRDPHAGHGGGAHGAGVDVLGLAAMIVAMMLPLTIPGVRQVTRSSGNRAVIGFLSGYMAVWMLTMLIIHQAWRLAASHAESTVAMTGVIIAAVAWEIAPAKRRLSGCGRVPHARQGWRSHADSARHGALAGGNCVASCWALMTVCVAFAHSIGVMAVLFAVQLAGRYRPSTSPALTALAVLATCLASLAMRMAAHHHA
jgi:hypothetical protein